MMSPQQITLVKKSWKLLRKVDPVLLGDVFYSKLFHEAPQTKALFTAERESQSRKLIDMLNMIVARLDFPDTVNDDLKYLGERHVRYGVKPHHYEAVGQSLIWTLEQGLGNDWNEEIRDAWIACYAMISMKMQEH